MKKRILVNSLIAISIAIGFSACGGGGGGDDASFENSESKIPINVKCLETTPTVKDIATYILLQSGDVIVKAEDNTTISTYHDINNEKRVCFVSGSAYIIRK
jgi:hypothetical protein